MPIGPYTYQYGEALDPDHADNDNALCIQGVVATSRFLDDLLTSPPDDMKGQYIDEQTEAWPEARGSVNSICSELSRRPPGELARVGLAGSSARAKFRQLKDAISDFFKLRTSARAAKAFQVAINILGSIANLVGASEALKEAFEALKYIADSALRESHT